MPILAWPHFSKIAQTIWIILILQGRQGAGNIYLLKSRRCQNSSSNSVGGSGSRLWNKIWFRDGLNLHCFNFSPELYAYYLFFLGIDMRSKNKGHGVCNVKQNYEALQRYNGHLCEARTNMAKKSYSEEEESHDNRDATMNLRRHVAQL